MHVYVCICVCIYVGRYACMYVCMLSDWLSGRKLQQEGNNRM